MTDAEAQLEGFIARFSDDVAGQARAILGRLRARLPGAVALVYDNYNALAVGFCASEKPSSLVLSVAVYPNWVSLFFVGGPGLDDPHGLLKGEGSGFATWCSGRAPPPWKTRGCAPWWTRPWPGRPPPSIRPRAAG